MLNQLKKIYHWSNTWVGTIVIVLTIIFFVAQAFVIPSGSMKRSLLIGDMLFVKKFSYGIPIPHIPWIEVPILPDIFGNGHLKEGEKPQREDIVVFRFPRNTSQHFVKRCFATGGDEILFQDKKMYLHPHEGDEYITKNYPKSKLKVINNKLWVLNPYKKNHDGIQYDPNDNTFEMAHKYKANNDFAMQFVYTGNIGAAYYFKVPKDEYFMVGDNRDHSYDSRFWGPVKYRYIVGKPWFVYFSWDEDYKIRWKRVGRSIETLQNDPDFIDKSVHLGSERT